MGTRIYIDSNELRDLARMTRSASGTYLGIAADLGRAQGRVVPNSPLALWEAGRLERDIASIRFGLAGGAGQFIADSAPLEARAVKVDLEQAIDAAVVYFGDQIRQLAQFIVVAAEVAAREFLELAAMAGDGLLALWRIEVAGWTAILEGALMIAGGLVSIGLVVVTGREVLLHRAAQFLGAGRIVEPVESEVTHLLRRGQAACGATSIAANADSMDDYMRAIEAMDADEIIVVRQIVNGQERYVVLMRGIDGTVLSPGTRAINDYGHANGSLHGLEGNYEVAVRQALKAAGAGDGANVVMIGHSQGGIVANNLASKSSFNATWGGESDGRPRYHVSAVVTGGSPVDHFRMAPGTSYLQMVANGDPVPHADRYTMHLGQRSEVRFDPAAGSPIDDHNARNYTEEMMRRLDAQDPQFRAFNTITAGQVDEQSAVRIRVRWTGEVAA